MENPQPTPRETKLESGVRPIPANRTEDLPEMRTVEDLHRVIQERGARGVDAGKILDVYEAQQRASEEKTQVIKIPQAPAEVTQVEARPQAPRMTMAEALAEEKRGGNYGEPIPFLAPEDVQEVADDEIEDMTAEAEEWTDEDEAQAAGTKKAA